MSRETGYTVLLIEADTSLRRLIALGLKHRGMQVTEINSLAALADQPIANPDLLLLAGRNPGASLPLDVAYSCPGLGPGAAGWPEPCVSPAGSPGQAFRRSPAVHHYRKSPGNKCLYLNGSSAGNRLSRPCLYRSLC